MWGKLKNEKGIEVNDEMYFYKKIGGVFQRQWVLNGTRIFRKKECDGALLAFLSLRDIEQGSFMKEIVNS